MKKISKFVYTALIAVLSLSFVAFAKPGDNIDFAVYNKTEQNGYDITLKKADNSVPTSVSATVYDETKVVYTEVSKVQLSFTGVEDNEYVVFLLLGENTVPTESNLKYIDQKTGETDMTFDIYPNTLDQTGTYKIYISSTKDAYKEVGSFEVISNITEADYILGDVDGISGITALDALAILQHVASMDSLLGSNLQAADVDGSQEVNGLDALRILQYITTIIEEL